MTNETVFAEAPTEVRGALRSEGYGNQQVKVQLLWEGAGDMKVVDTALVGTGIEGGSVPVVLRHTPREPGEYKMTHYAFATALMNLVLVPTQSISGLLAHMLGYETFFLVVMLASIPSIFAAWLAPFPRSREEP